MVHSIEVGGHSNLIQCLIYEANNTSLKQDSGTLGKLKGRPFVRQTLLLSSNLRHPTSYFSTYISSANGFPVPVYRPVSITETVSCDYREIPCRVSTYREQQLTQFGDSADWHREATHCRIFWA
jgi:hypothetical protein